jgi:hypothetical protein
MGTLMITSKRNYRLGFENNFKKIDFQVLVNLIAIFFRD